MSMVRRTRARVFSLLTFLLCLPPAFFVGITLIGHARLVPYVSVWLDRLVLFATALGLPLLAGYAVHQFVSGRRIGTDVLSAALERAFPGRTKEARIILARYGTQAHEREQERVRLAAVYLSGGDIAELNRLIDMAKQDRRDILMWAGQKRRGESRS